MRGPDDTVAAVVGGDRRATARAISTLENGGDGAQAIRDRLASHVGRAHVIGVTGPPGGGKSTLVSALIRCLRSRMQTVAVVAVDPSSPFSGGAILGDRVRMGEHQADDGVFIRSLASRGHLGGLSAAAADAVDVLDAAGWDTVIVETVGAGQSEVEVTRIADTRLVVCPPGLGDGIQALKAGVLEIADAFVVSKADLPGADSTAADLRAMLALRRSTAPLPPVFPTTAASGAGVDELTGWLVARGGRGSRHAAAVGLHRDPHHDHQPDKHHNNHHRHDKDHDRDRDRDRDNDHDRDRDARALMTRAFGADAYARHLGLELVAAALGRATVSLCIGAMHINFNGRCHGGALFSLADTALGLACNGQGTIATLIDGHVTMSSAVELGERLFAEASEVSRSRKIGVYRVEITRAGGAHVASLTGTVYLLDKPLFGADR